MTVWVVVGPTASGKTALGVELALRTGAEVVNADALQCYRGMDIGTAKPTAEERRGVPHHCLDLWEPSEEATLAMWRAEAVAAIEALDHAVVVGGSGLYVRALLDDWDLPGTDPDLRAALEAELAEHGSGHLHARLTDVDPVAAAAILPSNGRRLVRALEVVTMTGRPFAATLPEPGPPRWGARIVSLDPDLATVDARIGARAQDMFDRGLVAEAVSLDLGRTAARAIGYAQALAVAAGESTTDQAIADTAQATRRFVRRQRSWWRADPRVRHLAPSYGEGPQAWTTLADQVLVPPQG